MKKWMMLAVAVVGMRTFGDYAYLNFLVDQAKSDNPITFEYARVGVADQQMFLNIQGTASPWVVQDGTGLATDAYRVDLGIFATPAYAFYVELYDESLGIVGVSESVNYSALTSYIATDMGQGGVTDAWRVSTFNVPEPTSGLLLLLGCSLLALCRRHPTVKVLAAVLLSVSSSLSFAAANDSLITFSTVGPDVYADGTTVRDGECYALVWTKTGSAFGGIAANGVVLGTDSRVLVFAPVAKGGRCPTVIFEVDAMLAEALKDGSFAVYLLDTRLANGTLGGLKADGRPMAVNGYGEVKGGSKDRTGSDSVQVAGEAVVTSVQSAIPAGTPQPQITAMKIIGDKVFLTVRGTLSCLQYVASPAGIDDESTQGEGEGVQGCTEGEITIIAPKKGNSGLYRIKRK